MKYKGFEVQVWRVNKGEYNYLITKGNYSDSGIIHESHKKEVIKYMKKVIDKIK